MAALVFLGSPGAAVVPLEALVAAGHDVRLVVSRPDARRGRGGTVSPSPVAAAARRLGLTVTDDLDDVAGAGAELGVVVAYGRIVPAGVLDALPMVNLHFSLLPRWRGAAPVERAILAGDEETGVCVMRLEAGLDTGPVLARRTVPTGDAHAGALTEALARIGAELLVALLAAGPGALGPGEPQAGEATYAAKIDPGELRIDWSRPVAEVQRLVRLDRAWTTFRGRRLGVLDAGPGPGGSGGEWPGEGGPGTVEVVGHGAGERVTVRCGAGVLELLTVQAEGGRPLGAAQWARGARPGPGERLGADEAPR
ncbi:MAG: methionyl-tRNA formyltransferase [Acidobacteriota bacterium]|nr:methionyl-tRNA formyltransferase [Acidobacteriota bacterium]